MAKEQRNYLVHIEFHVATTDYLAKVGLRIVEAMKDLSGTGHEMVWRSLDRSVVAYVLKTSRPARAISNRLKGTSSTFAAEMAGIPRDRVKDWGPAVLGPNDKIAVLELGADISETGYGRLAGWMTSHQS